MKMWCMDGTIKQLDKTPKKTKSFTTIPIPLNRDMTKALTIDPRRYYDGKRKPFY